jgi:hypothetical protein
MRCSGKPRAWTAAVLVIVTIGIAGCRRTAAGEIERFARFARDLHTENPAGAFEEFRKALGYQVRESELPSLGKSAETKTKEGTSTLIGAESGCPGGSAQYLVSLLIYPAIDEAEVVRATTSTLGDATGINLYGEKTWSVPKGSLLIHDGHPQFVSQDPLDGVEDPDRPRMPSAAHVRSLSMGPAMFIRDTPVDRGEAAMVYRRVRYPTAVGNVEVVTDAERDQDVARVVEVEVQNADAASVAPVLKALRLEFAANTVDEAGRSRKPVRFENVVVGVQPIAHTDRISITFWRRLDFTDFECRSIFRGSFDLP